MVALIFRPRIRNRHKPIQRSYIWNGYPSVDGAVLNSLLRRCPMSDTAQDEKGWKGAHF